MKKIVSVILLLIFTNVLLAQQYNLKKDFGAKGDGKSDDSKAWNDAIKALDKNKSGTLIIPTGTYIIGSQITDKTGKIVEQYTNTINNGNNIKIQGSVNNAGKPSSIIKYKNNFKHGIFSGKTASGGVALRFENGNNITIENISFDGNLNNANLGQKSTKSDLWHIGIYLNFAKNVNITNVNTSNFGLDGIYLRAPNVAGVNVTLNKVVSEYNARQGLSITAGRGVRINNSTFTKTGKGRLFVSPGANVDIENHSQSPIQDIIINNSSLDDNHGGSGSLTIAGTVEGLKVINTTIATNSLYAIQSNFSASKDFYFENCIITGLIEMQWGTKSKTGKGQTVFNKCTFNDNLNTRVASTRRALLNTYDDVVLNNCTFNLGTNRKLIHSYNNVNENKSNAVIMTNPTVKTIQDKKQIQLKDINKVISTPKRVLIK